MHSRHLWLSALLVMSATTQSFAQDAARGKNLAETCLGCHGVNGEKNAYPSFSVPKLGGQHAEYIVSALNAYKNGERNHPTMAGQASSLSDSDIKDIAAYFAGFKEE